MDSNVEEKIVFKQPKTFEERKTAAALLVDRLKYRAPLAIDGIDDGAGLAFGAWPERIYIIDRGGTVLYKGGLGPFGFHPDEAEKKLTEVLASTR